MTAPQLVRDTSGGAVQALNPITTVAMAVTVSSSRAAMPVNTDLIRLAANVDCYVAFGDSGVNATASDMYFPAGVEIFSVPGPGFTHLAVLRVGASDGILSATKMV